MKKEYIEIKNAKKAVREAFSQYLEAKKRGDIKWMLTVLSSEEVIEIVSSSITQTILDLINISEKVTDIKSPEDYAAMDTSNINLLTKNKTLDIQNKLLKTENEFLKNKLNKINELSTLTVSESDEDNNYYGSDIPF